MPVGAAYRPDPRLLEIADLVGDPVEPARFPRHELRFRNDRWAARIGLDALDAAEWEQHLGRLTPLPDNVAPPLALRYHGHQFGVYNAALGDGRGFLHAQVRDTADGRLLDLGTKGSGETPYSRGGDGRLTLKGGVREVLATEMLEALGVYTSKSLSLFETGEALVRGDEPSPTRSSMLVRLSHSHVRFGSFQRLLYLGDHAGIRRLLEWTVAVHFPTLHVAADLPAAFLRTVVRRSAELCASWMAAGFVHGVLNTDNMNVTGESFDYGLYRFLPHFDPGFVAAYFDHGGRYAFGRQPSVVLWNLHRLADTLAPIADTAALGAALATYEGIYREVLRDRLLARLGVASAGPDEDAGLVEAAIEYLGTQPVGWERFFFDWHRGESRAARALSGPAGAHYAGPAFDVFRRRLAHHAPRGAVDPYFEGDGPCTMLIDEIEALWTAIDERDDWGPFEAKVRDVRRMGAAQSR